MGIANLDRDRGFALIGEMISTGNLLGYGTKVLREARFIETTRDPILTMLSIGVEKLLKLSLGVISLSDTGCWPTKHEMRSFGHGVVGLHDAVMRKLSARVPAGDEYVLGLIDGVESDQVLTPLLAVLDRYGRQGRFYNLDHLAEAKQVAPDPRVMWDAVEKAAQEASDVKRLFAAATENINSNDAWDRFYLATQGRIADSAFRLWDMLSRAGQKGVLGETGRTFGFQIAPAQVGRQ